MLFYYYKSGNQFIILEIERRLIVILCDGNVISRNPLPEITERIRMSPMIKPSLSLARATESSKYNYTFTIPS